jgi:ribosome-associated heat shock protein Hsp15
VTQAEAPSAEPVRLDVWLDVSCLFKTRADAQKACRGGKVEVNGQAAKPNRRLRVGDELRITRRDGRRQIVVVAALAERSLPKTEARALYEDRTPPPTPEELERRRLEKQFHASFQPPRTTPDKRERRALRRLKGWAPE